MDSTKYKATVQCSEAFSFLIFSLNVATAHASTRSEHCIYMHDCPQSFWYKLPQHFRHHVHVLLLRICNCTRSEKCFIIAANYNTRLYDTSFGCTIHCTLMHGVCVCVCVCVCVFVCICVCACVCVCVFVCTDTAINTSSIRKISRIHRLCQRYSSNL